MIHEYALEPELVASWHERLTGRFFVDQFGFGTGRVVSRYPKKWRKLIWDAFQATFGEGLGDIERKRIEELLARLIAPEVRRPECIWDAARDWLTNAESEHGRKPFFAILARENPRTHGAVMCADDVLSGTPAAWPAPSSAVVQRTAEAMTASIAPMLDCATKVLFVDPYFRAIKPEFNRPLAAFLKVIVAASSGATLELHTADREDAPPWDSFRRECEEYLPRFIPKNLTLVVRRWKNRAGGEKLHNRYVLTDIGGVQFGAGLGEGDQGATDDITLLGAEAYRIRLEAYSGPQYAFDLEGEVTIKGEAGTD